MSELDVQLHPTGVAIIPPDSAWDENLPGQVNLTNDEADDLRDMLNEAWLNRRGLQPMSIQWADAEGGDVLPAFGLTLIDTPHVLPNTDLLRAYAGRGVIDLPANLEITVHRRIE